MDRSKKPIMANISNRHLHVSEQDLQVLFGTGAKLTNIRDLVQPGQFACKETVDDLKTFGAEDFIGKPFSISSMKEKIEKILKTREVL